jgi:hypothetical protein
VKLIDSHPLVKADDVNRIFVLVMDTTDAGVLAAKVFEDELSLPQGTPDHWTNGLGEYNLLILVLKPMQPLTIVYLQDSWVCNRATLSFFVAKDARTRTRTPSLC